MEKMFKAGAPHLYIFDKIKTIPETKARLKPMS